MPKLIITRALTKKRSLNAFKHVFNSENYCNDNIYIYIYIVIRETGQFSSKGIINDFIGNLNRLTVSRQFTEQAV